MVSLESYAAILGAATVTYAYRISGITLADHLPDRGRTRKFMEALPGSILTALIAPGILQSGPWGWVAIASAVACAVKTKNILLSMLAGMAVMIIKRNLF